MCNNRARAVCTLCRLSSQEADVRVIPVVRRDAATILHPPPVRPARRRLAQGLVPDALAPDDVVNPESGRIVHDPFRDRLPNRVIGPDHEIQGPSLSMLTRLCRIAPDILHLPGKLVEDLVPGRDDMRPTIGRWDDRVGTTGARGRSAAGSAQAALEVSRTRAQASLGSTRAGAGEFAGAARTASLGAAPHVVWVVGAEASHRGAATLRAVCGRDADTGFAVRSAGAIEGSLTNGGGEDQRGQDRMEMHGKS